MRCVQKAGCVHAVARSFFHSVRPHLLLLVPSVLYTAWSSPTAGVAASQVTHDLVSPAAASFVTGAAPSSQTQDMGWCRAACRWACAALRDSPVFRRLRGCLSCPDCVGQAGGSVMGGRLLSGLGSSRQGLCSGRRGCRADD